MNDRDIQTSTYGPELKVTENLTHKDFIELCKLLTVEFGEGYEFIPEGISEGGILWKKWPGYETKHYKTMRVPVNRHAGDPLEKCGSSKTCRWPYIHERTVMVDWESDESILVYKSKQNRIYTYLKAYHGAPAWTVDELNKFKKCFKQFGIHCYRIPSKTKLKNK